MHTHMTWLVDDGDDNDGDDDDDIDAIGHSVSDCLTSGELFSRHGRSTTAHRILGLEIRNAR